MSDVDVLFIDDGPGIHELHRHNGYRGGLRVPGGCRGYHHHHLDHAAHAEGARREGSKARGREALYGEFITEASHLTIDALSHSLEKPETFVKLYGILGRIRLVAADPVLDAAEACTRQLVDLYAKPNMTIEQIRVALERDQLDPIRDFSVACRKELLEIASGG